MFNNPAQDEVPIVENYEEYGGSVASMAEAGGCEHAQMDTSRGYEQSRQQKAAIGGYEQPQMATPRGYEQQRMQREATGGCEQPQVAAAFSSNFASASVSRDNARSVRLSHCGLIYKNAGTFSRKNVTTAGSISLEIGV